MKKNLLPGFLLVFAAASAQNNHQQSSTICVSSVTTTQNQFTTALGHKTNFWYDKDIDVLTFVHVLDTGSLAYAYSLDHGATWSIDTMLFEAPSYLYSGRYPQGVIYNPTGNTNPSNAFVTCFGVTQGAAGYYEGTTAIGSGSNQQTVYPFTSYPAATIPQGGTIVKNTGTTWWSAAGGNSNNYNDTIILAKGTFGGGNFTYSFTPLAVPVCTDNNGNKMYRNQAIIFDDSGQHGYLVVIGNDGICQNGSDSAMGLIVYYSSDGGNSWSRLDSPDLSLVSSMLTGGSTYSSATQLDLAVDQTHKLHIALPIIPFNTGNIIYYSYPSGSWGLFDVSMEAASYQICLIARPHTYYGEFGVGPILYEENRFQLSRSWDGSKIFYTWFDTDTNLFGAGLNNYCDMHSVGLDLQNGLYTSEVNFTATGGSIVPGNCLFGNVSYYTINDGVDENIPALIDIMQFSPSDPVSFFYIGCAAMSNYVNPGICVGVNKIGSPENFMLGNCIIYPNPASDKATLNIMLDHPSEVRVNICNTLGQVLSSSSYKELHKGNNQLSIDVSSLSKGLYFYTVKAGQESVTRSMSVK